MAKPKYIITVTGEPFLRPGVTFTIETKEKNFDKVLDDLLERTYAVDSLLGTLEKLSKVTADLSEASKKYLELNEKRRKELGNLEPSTPHSNNPAED